MNGPGAEAADKRYARIPADPVINRSVSTRPPAPPPGKGAGDLSAPSRPGGGFRCPVALFSIVFCFLFCFSLFLFFFPARIVSYAYRFRAALPVKSPRPRPPDGRSNFRVSAAARTTRRQKHGKGSSGIRATVLFRR